MRNLKAVIFDMDGVLIDSEPFWKRAQMEVFGDVGVALSHADTERTIGIRIDEVVEFWFEHRPWEGRTRFEVVEAIVDDVVRMVHKEGERMEGVTRALSLFESMQIQIGLATSSADRLIDAVVSALDMTDVFGVRCSAAHEERGKPDPAVFLTTASRMGVNPSECLVVEDSAAGVVAGKAAGMTVLAIPAPHQFEYEVFDSADLKLHSLADLSKNTLELLID